MRGMFLRGPSCFSQDPDRRAPGLGARFNQCSCVQSSSRPTGAAAGAVRGARCRPKCSSPGGKTVLIKYDAQILQSFVTFNNAILKTNFFTPTKVAISYRLDPSFLPESEYPTPAYGLFLVIGNDFDGLHPA